MPGHGWGLHLFLQICRQRQWSISLFLNSGGPSRCQRQSRVCAVWALLHAAFSYFIPVWRLNNGFRFWAVETLQQWLARLCSGAPCPTRATADPQEWTQGPHLWGRRPGGSEGSGGGWSKLQDVFPNDQGVHGLWDVKQHCHAQPEYEFKVSVSGKNCPLVSHDARGREDLRGTHSKLGEALMTAHWEQIYSNQPLMTPPPMFCKVLGMGEIKWKETPPKKTDLINYMLSKLIRKVSKLLGPKLTWRNPRWKWYEIQDLP